MHDATQPTAIMHDPRVTEPLRQFVNHFGYLLVRREFAAASALLSPDLAGFMDAGDLEEAFDEMIVHFDNEDAAIVHQAFTVVDEDDDGIWIFAPIEGDGELEAITVAVKAIDGELCINDISWGTD